MNYENYVYIFKFAFYLNKGILTVVNILRLSALLETILGLGQLQMMFGFLPLGVSLFPKLSKFKFQRHLLVISGKKILVFNGKF